MKLTCYTARETVKSNCTVQFKSRNFALRSASKTSFFFSLVVGDTAQLD